MKRQIGSAVTINLGNRHFLATAAHVIADATDELFVVLGDESTENVSNLTTRHVRHDDDVGIIELDSKQAQSLGRVFVTEEEIGGRLDCQQKHEVVVLGYPGQPEVLKVTEAPSPVDDQTLVRTFDFRTLTYVTETVVLSEWPQVPLQRHAADPLRDIFGWFDPSNQLFLVMLKTLDPASEHAFEVKLPGVSGGGIWTTSVERASVWRPQVKLIGLQSSVLKAKKMLRATPIQCCLELVRENYPDLECIVDGVLGR